MADPTEQEAAAALASLIEGMHREQRIGCQRWLTNPKALSTDAEYWQHYYIGEKAEFWAKLKVARPDWKLNGCDRCHRMSHGLYAVEGARSNVCAACRDGYYRQCGECRRFWHMQGKISGSGGVSLWHVVAGPVGQGQYVCNECYQGHNDYRHCPGCQRFFLPANHGQDARFCLTCSPPDPSACQSRGSLDFEFPALTLASKTIAAEQIMEITMPGGVISHSGRSVIRKHLWNETGGSKLGSGIDLFELTADDSPFGEWQTKEGNFSKRLAKLLYETRGLKMSDELMAKIANLAQQYAAKDTRERIAFTRNINRPASEFYNGGSCWWGGYSVSRCHFKAMGGIALRTFTAQDKPAGRAFLIPLDEKLRPTFTLPASAYFAFNAYGPDLFAFGRMVALLTGKSYRAVEVVRRGSLYINNNRGILIGEQSMVSDTPEISIPAKKLCTCKVQGQ